MPKQIRARATTVATAIATLALVTLASGPAAEAGTTVYRGAFTCESDGRPLVGARIEMWETLKRWLPEVPPNFVRRATTRADDHGAWGFTVRGGESNWRIRVVLDGPYAGIRDWPFPWSWYTHTLRSQNNVPVRDYGTQAVAGYQCGIYTGLDEAGREYQAQVGVPPPQGVTGAQAGAPTAGVPFTLYDELYWPSGYPALRKDGISVAKHEFAHVFRHLFDGSAAHFAGDAARYWYLRHHDATSCTPTSSGFAFNEGWAEYLIFDPIELADVEVRLDGHHAGLAVPLRIKRHVHPRAQPRPQGEAKPTGVDYLALIRQRRERELERRIDYRHLPGPPVGGAGHDQHTKEQAG